MKTVEEIACKLQQLKQRNLKLDTLLENVEIRYACDVGNPYYYERSNNIMTIVMLEWVLSDS